MGSMAQKSVLMLCGEFMEAYETIVPLYVLQAFGVSVHCVSPGRKTGDKCVMAAHDLLGLEAFLESFTFSSFQFFSLAIVLCIFSKTMRSNAHNWVDFPLYYLYPKSLDNWVVSTQNAWAYS